MISIKAPSGQLSGRQQKQISDVLSQGGIIIIPTDTIYAICCDALNPKAIDRLCAIKHINPDKTNLSIICHSIAQAAEYAKIDNNAFRILKQNTPRPFTFLLPAASRLPRAFRQRKTVGIRIPDCDIPLSILQVYSSPLLTTSIEFVDDDYATSPGLIAEEYDSIADLIVEGQDGGTEPSTIVDLRTDDPEIIRQGKGILS